MLIPQLGLVVPVNQALSGGYYEKEPHMAYTYFASGSNRLGDIMGLSDINHPIGVCVSDLTEVTLRALEELENKELKVFVDSGAFEEFTSGTLIDQTQWELRLERYRRLAKALGPQMFCVAPDKIGDQNETLRRLERHRDAVRELHALGANILLPLQGGTDPLPVFFYRCMDLLGIGVIPALPMKAAGTPVETALAFLKVCRPKAVHFLGLGPESSTVNVEKLVTECEALVPGIDVYLDSCMIRRLVGRRNGARGNPRLLTEAQDWAQAEIETWTNSGAPKGTIGWDNGSDLTEVLFEPELWITAHQRRELCDWLEAHGLKQESKLFQKDPSKALQDDIVANVLYEPLRELWTVYFNGRASTPERKRRAIRMSL